MEVQGKTLEKATQIEDTVTATFEDFEFIVEALDKAAGVAIEKIVGNFSQVIRERVEERIKTGQMTGLYLLNPGFDFFGRLGFG